MEESSVVIESVLGITNNSVIVFEMCCPWDIMSWLSNQEKLLRTSCTAPPLASNLSLIFLLWEYLISPTRLEAPTGQKFLNLSQHLKNHLEDKWKKTDGPHPTVSDSADLGWGSRMCMF